MQDNNDYIIFDDQDDEGYPWKGALIAISITAVFIFVIFLPWVIGWIKIIGWIF